MVVQLIIVDYVPLGPAHQALGLGFIIWDCSKQEVFRDWSPPVWDGARHPDNA
jgi:hypothetical protein